MTCAPILGMEQLNTGRVSLITGESAMKRLILAGLLATASALSACEEPTPREEPMADAIEAPMVAPSAEDAGVPASAPSATDTPPVDPSALSPEKRSSEETVQPESETLFY